MLVSMWTNAVTFRVNVQNELRLQHRLSVACAIHWSRCQSLPGPDGPIPPRHAGAALPRPWSCGACTHALVGSSIPHCVVDGVQIRTVRRSHRGWNGMRKGRDCFWNTNILDFIFCKVATQLRWGGSLYNWSIKNFLWNLTVKESWKSAFICRSYDQKTKWPFFWNTVYMWFFVSVSINLFFSFCFSFRF